ncbi:hypothetical protein ABIC07_001397 [Bradyrhizobium sp. RT9a]
MARSKLPDWVVPNAKFRYIGHVWHVRAIVDDGVVARWRDGPRWQYEWLARLRFTSTTNCITRVG